MLVHTVRCGLAAAQRPKLHCLAQPPAAFLPAVVTALGPAGERSPMKARKARDAG